jgi:hypothetical protein
MRSERTMRVEWSGKRPKSNVMTEALKAGAADAASRHHAEWVNWSEARGGFSALWPDFTDDEFAAHQQGYSSVIIDEYNRAKRLRQIEIIDATVSKVTARVGPSQMTLTCKQLHRAARAGDTEEARFYGDIIKAAKEWRKRAA